MNELKRLGYPVLIICLAAFFNKLIEKYIVGNITHTLLILVSVGFLFLFGISLNKSRKKKSNAIFRKALAIIILILLLCMQLGYFELPYISSWFTYLGMESFYMNMLYIFCGYLFVD